MAAVRNGHSRLVNTGPWSVIGGHAKTFSHRITEDMPAHTGLDLYDLRNISMAIEILDWLRFTYIFEN